MSLQKSMLRRAKNVIFSILCILVDRPMGGGGGLNPITPPLAYALGGETGRSKHFFAGTSGENQKSLRPIFM